MSLDKERIKAFGYLSNPAKERIKPFGYFQGLIKKGLRHKTSSLLGFMSLFDSRPAKEGIKTMGKPMGWNGEIWG